MKERQPNNQERRDERMQQVLQTLERGIETILTSEGYRDYLATMSRFHGYSFGNIALIMAQRSDATMVAGFHTWKSMDRHVKKGEKGIRIMVPYKARVEQDEGDPLFVVRGFGVGYVWDIAQTVGRSPSSGPRCTGRPSTTSSTYR